MIQLMTRHRRLGEEIEHPNFWDEIVDGKNTGRIVTTFKVVGNKIQYSYLEGYPEVKEIQENEYSTSEPIQPVVEIQTKTMYKVVVNHCGGCDEFHTFDKIDIPEYKNEINSKFWDGFVKDIKVTELKVVDDG